MIERPSVEYIIRLNEIECEKTGEPHVIRDRDGLEGAVGRPFGSFDGTEHFPSLLHKAAALLHAIASRQVFINGNKRTAWLAALIFLDNNGVDLGKVPKALSNAMVRAASVDHGYGVEGVLAWFQTVQNLSFPPSDSQEYMHVGGTRVPGFSGELPVATSFTAQLQKAPAYAINFTRERVSMEDLESDSAEKTEEKVASLIIPIQTLRYFQQFLDLELGPQTQRLVAPSATPRDVPQVVPKVGQNRLCPCGSGKKYKRCHGAPTTS